MKKVPTPEQVQASFEGITPDAAWTMSMHTVAGLAAALIEKMSIPLAIARTWPGLPDQETYDGLKRALAVEIDKAVRESFETRLGKAVNLGEVTLTANLVVLELVTQRTREALAAIRAHPDIVTNPSVRDVSKEDKPGVD